MDHVPDDILMAFVDGELSGEQQAWVEARLAHDVGLRRRLEPFAVTRATLPLIFEHPLNEPVPQHLMSLIRDGVRPARGATTSSSTAADMPPAQRTSRRPSRTAQDVEPNKGFLDGLFGGWSLTPAFGYAAVLLLGAGAGWMGAVSLGAGQGEAVRYENGGLVASRGLLQALDTVPSGTAQTADGLLITPASSFRSNDGRLCRQYQMVAPGTPTFAGLACRSTDGRWKVTVHTEAATVVTSEVGSGGQSKVVAPVLDAAVTGIIAGDSMSDGEEATLIENGWGANDPVETFGRRQDRKP